MTPNVRCIVVEEIIGGVFLDVEIENDEVWDVEKVRGVWPAPKFEPVKSDALG